MKALITGPGMFTVLDGKEPEVGRRYVLEEAETATSEQNRAFHALVTEYFKSGCYSWTVESFDELRDYVKRDLGAGFESYAYADIVDGEPVLRTVKRFADIPESIRRDPRMAQYVRGRLKSWSDYTKAERTKAIDGLIAEMRTAGVNSRKFDEILAGMGAEAVR